MTATCPAALVVPDREGVMWWFCNLPEGHADAHESHASPENRRVMQMWPQVAP